MACRTPLRPPADLEDWSNDGDFDFGVNNQSNDPSVRSVLPKPHLNLTSCDGRTVKMLSTQVPNISANTFASRTTNRLVESDSGDGIMGSSSSGSAFTTGTKYADMDDLDIMEGEDGGYPTIKALETRSSSSGTGLKHSHKPTIHAEVTGTALNGRAYITRLGSSGSRANVKQQDSEMSEDLDWGNRRNHASSSRSAAEDLKGRLKLRLAKQHDEPESNKDNWDDFDAGFASDTDDDSRQTTLKAGTVTYKNIAGRGFADLKQTALKPGRPPSEDEDMEDGLQLPLTLKHLKLITRSPQAGALRHRSSRSSLASATTGQTSDWDNIGTPGNARTRAQGGSSATSSRTTSSIIPGTDQSEADEQRLFNRVEHGQATDDDDLEEGLVLPVPTFFSSGRTRELNRLLDQKRKPGLSGESPSNLQARQPSGPSRASSTLMKPTLSSVAKLKYVPLAQDQLEDQLEDGLVLKDERTELTHGRLARIRQSRANAGTPTGPRNVAGGTLKHGYITGRQRVDTAVQTTDTLGRQGHPSRSVSGSNGLLATPSTSRILRSSPASTAPHINPSTANTPNRLRHQKSHSRLGRAPPSPSLAKRQSMSSLREMAQLHETTGYTTYHPPAPNAPSYTAQTAASAARSAGKIRKSSTESEEWPTGAASRTPSERSLAIRSTSSSLNSRAGGSRAPIPSVFTHHADSDKTTTFAPTLLSAASRLRKSNTFRSYGDGTELDDIDDLQVDRAKEGLIKLPKGNSRFAGGSLGRSAGQHLGLGRPPRSTPSPIESTTNATAEKRKQHPAEPVPAARQAATSKGKPIARKAGLIRHLGRVEKKKVGDMTWNPETLRWEGNYQVLRDFDAQVLSSARPALITHYAAFASMKATSSSRSTVVDGPAESKPITSEPTSAAATPPLNAARVVGNMMFDPEKMCWISTLSAEDDEPDPFAAIDEEDSSDRSSRRGGSGFGDQDGAFGEDDDDDDEDVIRGGTITKDTARALMHGIRTGGAGHRGLMRFSSAATTSSMSSAATSTASHDGEGYRYQGGGGALGLTQEDGEDGDWDGKVQPRFGSTLRPDPQTDSGFKVKTPHPQYTPDDFRPSRHVSHELWTQSIAAEARHNREMHGWRVDPTIIASWTARDWEREREREKRREEKRLWEIRNLAMRS